VGRNWISFRELFDSEIEPRDRGVTLENPIFKNNVVEFAIEDREHGEVFVKEVCGVCNREFMVRSDYDTTITCSYCGRLVEVA